MKPAISQQGKSEAGLQIVHRYRDRSSLAFGSQSFQFLVQRAGNFYA
jgi:hypothetical protein